MMSSLRSEFRKVLSLRSTYVIFAISLALNLLFAFYVTGWRLDKSSLQSPTFLASQTFSAISAVGLFTALIAILLVTHEYRYNTIVYTLTANKSRLRILLAKFLTASAVAIFFTVFFGLLSPLLSKLAISIRDLDMAQQDLQVWNIAWRSLIAGWGYVMLGFIFALIIRVQVGAIAALFLLPATLEPLLGLLLKSNQAYLPFSTVNTLLGMGMGPNQIPHTNAAYALSLYVIVGLGVSAILFVHRDAN